jgi:hypothetical protein
LACRPRKAKPGPVYLLVNLSGRLSDLADGSTYRNGGSEKIGQGGVGPAEPLGEATLDEAAATK